MCIAQITPPPIRNLGNFFNFKKCQKDVFWDSFSRKMIAHAANTDVRTFAPFVLWSKLFCNKDQFSRLNQNFSKTDVPKNLPCLYRSSFTKTLWHQSASLIAICPTALPIIHCGIDPQREWESLEKIGLFCFLVYYCSNVSFPT